MSLLTGLTRGKGTGTTDAVTCPPDMSAELDNLTQILENKNLTIQQQNKQLTDFQSMIPNVKSDMYKLQNTVQANNDNSQSAKRTFHVSILVLVLLLIVGFIMYLYNQLISKQAMFIIENSKLFQDMAEGFKSGKGGETLQPGKEFGDSQVDKTGIAEKDMAKWNDVLSKIMTLISRGRFYLLLVIFGFMYAFTIGMYSLVYHGTDTNMAAQRIAISLSVILGFTFLFVNNQTMIKPFENVVGGGIVSMVYQKFVRETMHGIFKHKHFEGTSVFPGAELYYDFMLSVFTMKNMVQVIYDIYEHDGKYDFNINTDPENGVTKEKLKNLFRYILQKNTIGHGCWVYLASLTGVLVSMRYLFANNL